MRAARSIGRDVIAVAGLRPVAAIEFAAEDEQPVSVMGPEPFRPPGFGVASTVESKEAPRKWTRRRKSSRIRKLNKTKRGSR